MMNRLCNEFATAAELQIMEGFPPPADKRVNRSNAFWTPPYNRWSYQNMRMFFPTEGIPHAEKPSPLPKSIYPVIADLSVAKPDENGRSSGQLVDMETYFKETFTDSFVVVQEGQIVYENYLNGMTPDKPHQMMSVTKSFAGLFALMAVEEGLISEEDPIIKHLPELKNATAFSDATFGQVLDMTNAMAFNEDYVDPESDVQNYVVVVGLNEPLPGKTYAGSIYEYLATLSKDPNYEHGEIFKYQTPKVDVVNWAVNRVTGMSFGEYMYEELWSLLGTDSEAYILLDRNGTLFAGGGLSAPPNDLARFAAMLANNGAFNGQQIVSPSIIKQLKAGGSTEKFANPSSVLQQLAGNVLGANEWSYRAYWWVRHTPGKEAFMASGIHGQWIYVDVDRNIAIVKQSSQPDSETEYSIAYDIFGFDAIVSHLRK